MVVDVKRFVPGWRNVGRPTRWGQAEGGFESLHTIMTQANIPAAVQPGFDARGKFVKGNQLAKGRGQPHAQRLAELKALWYSALTDDRMKAIQDGLFDLAESAESEEVRLKALIYLAERTMGKVPDKIEMDVQGATPLHVNLSPDEMAQGMAFLRRLRGVVDGEVVPTSDVQPES